MKKSLLYLSAAFFMLVSAAYAQYSNSSMTGPWIMSGNGLQNYLVFNGSGVISEAGVVNASGQGTYLIQSNGSIAGTVFYGGNQVPFSGNMLNDSTAQFTIMSVFNFTVNKVKNQAQLGGVWGNQLVQTVGGNSTKNLTIEVDANGDIVNTSGLTGPVTGKLFYSNGKIAGYIKTGETAPWDQIQLKGTNFTGTVISGVGALDLNGSTANSYSLTQQSGLSAVEISNTSFKMYPNPASTQVVFEGPASGTLNVYDVLGNNVVSIVLTSSKTVLNISDLSKGMYVYNVSGSSVQGKFIVE